MIIIVAGVIRNSPSALLTAIPVQRRRRLLVPLDHPAVEAGFAHLPVDLQPALLREDGAEVSQEALHALLAFLG